MADKDESLSGAEIARVVRILVGPEEDWDEADGEFVMKLYGIELASSTKDSCNLILGVIKDFREKGDEVPPGLISILAKLASKDEKEDRFTMAPLEQIKALVSAKRSTGLAAAAVNQHFRGKRELSEEDEEILKQLSDELLNEERRELRG